MERLLADGDRRDAARNLAQPLRQRGQPAAAREDVMRMRQRTLPQQAAPCQAAARSAASRGRPRVRLRRGISRGSTIVPVLTQARHFATASLSPLSRTFSLVVSIATAETSVRMVGFKMCGSDLVHEMAANYDRSKRFPLMPIGMVVDDDALVRETVAEMLEDLCDHVYRGVGRSSKGWRCCAEHPDISVIVTDIAMPRLDGIAFASPGTAAAPGSEGAVRQRHAAAARQRGVPGQAVPARALVSRAAASAGRAVARLS